MKACLSINNTVAKLLRRFAKQRGTTLVETLVAIAVFGLVSTGIFVGLQTSSRGLALADEQQTAKNLAEYEMEYVMSQGYSSSYTPASIPGEYAGYSAVITASSVPSKDTNIQEIKITISHQGKPIILSDNCTLMDWKTKP